MRAASHLRYWKGYSPGTESFMRGEGHTWADGKAKFMEEEEEYDDDAELGIR